jgi:excisionase family DNA binding protein
VTKLSAIAGTGPPRLGLTLDEAAAAVGVSRDTFDRHIRHELRIVRRGRCLIVPIAEIERWLDREAARWSA